MVTSTPYQGVQVDSRYIPLKSLLQYVDGGAVTVNYYSQILNADDENSPQQVQRNPIYQQYLLVHNLELRIQTPLTASQDQESKEMLVPGSAILYPGLIPNAGDMFVADVGDGRAGIFAVTSAEKKSIQKDSTYRIDYVLVDIATDEKLADLRRKTIKEAHFVKDYLKFGQNPQVLAPDYNILLQLEDLYKILVGQFFNEFYSRDFATIIVPDQTLPTYDPFLTKALLDWVSTDEHPFVQKVKRLNVYSEPIMNTPTVWDALSKMSRTVLPAVARKMGLVNVINFYSPGEYGGVYYSGIQRVIYPIEGRTDADRGHGTASLTTGTNLQPGRYRWGELYRRELATTLPGHVYRPSTTNDLATIQSVTSLDTYLFTENFYKNKGPFGSVLEKLTADAINNRAIDGESLKNVAESVEHWATLERFYFIPVLIALLKVKIRTN